MKFSRAILALAVLATLVPLTAIGQRTGELRHALRASLEARLFSFTQAQATGQWDQVNALLGRYRRGGTGDHLYTPAHKQCLISQMQSVPLIAFDFTYEHVNYSTEILSKPPAQRWWYLAGLGTFRTDSREVKEQTKLVAYRDRGQWFFTPPNYDTYWEKKVYTQSDLSLNRASEYEIEHNPSSPIQITDLHALMDKKYPSLRNLTFVLRNTTLRKIKAFTVGVYSKGGSTTYSAGHEIEPNSSREERMSDTAYAYFCDGIGEQKLRIDRAVFEDDSEWVRKGAKPF
jgi:hypothetical protein